MTQERDALLHNISVLYKTAKLEIARKDAEIKELRSRLGMWFVYEGCSMAADTIPFCFCEVGRWAFSKTYSFACHPPTDPPTMLPHSLSGQLPTPTAGLNPSPQQGSNSMMLLVVKRIS